MRNYPFCSSDALFFLSWVSYMGSEGRSAMKQPKHMELLSGLFVEEQITEELRSPRNGKKRDGTLLAANADFVLPMEFLQHF